MMRAPVGPADQLAVVGCSVCRARPQIEADLVDWFAVMSSATRTAGLAS
jgi:hypothetical protein